MKYMSFVFIMAAVLAVILAAGCTSAPVKETSTTNVSTTVSQPAVRYVELQFTDGTKAGGKYVSETPGFVTIVPMYVIDEYGFMKAGGDLAGKEVGMKSDLITTMVNIDDPSSYVATTLKAQSDKAAALKKPTRKVTFSLDGTPYTGDDYSTQVDTSKPGYVTQVTRLERSKGKGEPAAFIEANIKTIIDEGLKPANKEKVIQEATNYYIDDLKKHIGGATIDEKPTYEAVLANGNKVTVRQFKKVPFYFNGNLNVFSYMPDDKTIVTVASSEDKQVFDEVIRTLNIGEMQNLQ